MKNTLLSLFFLCTFSFIAVSQDYIYWADYTLGNISRYDLESQNQEVLVSDNIENPASIAIDPETGIIYWTDGETNTIESYHIETTTRTILIDDGLLDPRGITLDLLNQKMYWVDLGTSKIQRANLDGSNLEDLITSGISEPHDIKLDLQNEKMYWTDRSSQKIQRANLDGSDIEDLITTNLANPSGILLDLENGLMYFGDSYNDFLAKANLDGSNMQILLYQEGGLFRMIFNPEQDRLFFTNIDHGKIYSCDLYGADLLTEMTSTNDQSGPTGLFFYTPPIPNNTNALILENLSLKESVNVYPNPASTKLNIELIDNFNNPIESIEMFSNDGKLIKQIDVKTRKTTIDTSLFPVGTYFLRLRFLNQGILSQTIIIQGA